MASTLTLVNTINFVRPILKMQPLDVTGLEPALTGGNIVLQRVLGPPCRWRFNRGTFSFSTVVTKPQPTTDYVVEISDFGFIEDCWYAGPDGKSYSVEGALSLPVTADTGRATQIAPQFDDNAGNITFRIKNGPSEVATLTGNYQRKAALITSLASTWGNVPDEFSYVFNMGFLTLQSLLVNDSRFPIFEQWFISALLGAQAGLSEQEKAIFIGDWMKLTATIQRSQGGVNNGLAARAK